jgi:catechol 2,3-dioxygenase-like lactoylglutathione lyase family enzyme
VSGAGESRGTPELRRGAALPPALEGHPPQGISEVILVVEDVQRSLVFYRDVVGLAVDNDGNRSFAWLWAGTPGRPQRVGITTGPLSFGAAHVKGPQHFAFGTENSRIDGLKAALERHGLEVEGPVEFRFWNARSIYFSDPDGNRVEFCGFQE